MELTRKELPKVSYINLCYDIIFFNERYLDLINFFVSGYKIHLHIYVYVYVIFLFIFVLFLSKLPNSKSEYARYILCF